MSKPNANKPKPASRRQKKRGIVTGTSLAGSAAPTETVFKLSSCAEKYFDSLLDPFTGPTDACVPVIPSFPSRKARYFMRGSLATGSGGYGFLAARANLDNNTNNGCFYSDNTYAGSSIGQPPTAGVATAKWNTEFASATFAGAAISHRLVSFGIRIKYTGTELNKGGTLYVLESPDHNELVSLNASQMMAFERCHRFQVDRDWVEVCYSPMNSYELEYTSGSSPFAGGNPNMILGILIQAPSTGTSLTFDFECFANWELMGSAVRGMTRSDADPVGYSVAAGALQMLNNGQIDRKLTVQSGTRPKTREHKSFLSALGQYALKSASGFLKEAPSLLGKAALATLAL